MTPAAFALFLLVLAVEAARAIPYVRPFTRVKGRPDPPGPFARPKGRPAFELIARDLVVEPGGFRLHVHRYRFRGDQLGRLYRVLARQAADPDYPLTWCAASRICHAARRAAIGDATEAAIEKLPAGIRLDNGGPNKPR